MHWPAPMTEDSPGKADKSLDWLDTWKAMEKLYLAHPDKLKAIGERTPQLSFPNAHKWMSDCYIAGVSNFSVEFTERLLKEAKVTPAVNQVELHPYVSASAHQPLSNL
jgi:glycerol 2-dehydrogenase (NADP+)